MIPHQNFRWRERGNRQRHAEGSGHAQKGTELRNRFRDIDSVSLFSLTESIPWNWFLGSLKILRIRAQKGGCVEGVGKGGREEKVTATKRSITQHLCHLTWHH